MAKLFISYTRADSRIVNETASLLMEAGIETWLDTYAMPYAVNWDDAVKEAICSSSFAVIFDSVSRREKFELNDSAVKREYEWIKETCLTCTVIDLDKEENQSAESVSSEIKRWMNEEMQKKGGQIDDVRKLVMNGYEYQNIGSMAGRNDIPHKFSGKLAKLFELFYMKNTLDSMPDVGNGQMDLRSSIYKYIRTNLIRTIRGICLRIAVVVMVAIVAFFGIKSGYTFIKGIRDNEVMSAIVENKREISQAIDSDVILGASFLYPGMVESPITNYYNYVKILSGTYPSEYYDESKATSYIDKLSKNGDKGYKLEADPVSGIIKVTNKDGEFYTFTIGGTPSDYDYSEDGKSVAVSTDNRAYVFFFGDAYLVEELQGSYEPIAEIYNSGDKVCAVTGNGNLVVWDLSENQEKIYDYYLSDGNIISSGRTFAAFISDGELILNEDNKLTKKVLPSEISDSVLDTAVSHDGTRIALAGMDSQGTSYIIEYDMGNQSFENMYSTENYIMSIEYSYDDLCIAFGDYTDNSLKELNLKKRSIQKKEKTDAGIYRIKAYSGGYVLGFTDGTVQTVDKKLKPSAKKAAVPFNNIAKQIAVSEKDGYYFLSTRSGNNTGNVRYSISGKEYDYFADMPGFGLVANSAVAVSGNDAYVAFGNDNGLITVWDVEDMLPVWTNTDIKDGITALCFADQDRSLVALGKSGTFYKVILGKQITECNPGDQSQQINEMRSQTRDLYDRMKELGLTDFTEDEFTMQEVYRRK